MSEITVTRDGLRTKEQLEVESGEKVKIECLCGAAMYEKPNGDIVECPACGMFWVSGGVFP